jgi:hypothetical protein
MSTSKMNTSVWKRTAGLVIFALLILVVVMAQRGRSGSSALTSREQPMTTQSKFYCNMKALSHVERARHLLLTGKLIMTRKDIVEMENGYELQFSPSSISVADLANWVTAESKCCPFFDFHIDLEQEGRLLCLRLTGEDGIKEFIRSEFKVAAKKDVRQ